MFIRLQTEFIALLFLAEMFYVTKLYVGIYKCYLNAASLMLGCFSINCELFRSCVDQKSFIASLQKHTLMPCLDRHLAFF